LVTSLVKGKLAGEILYNVNYFSILKDNFGIETKQSFTNNMKTEETSRTITKNNIFGPRIENIDIKKIETYLFQYIEAKQSFTYL